MMRFKIAASALVLAAALAPAGSAQSFDASALDIRNFIGRIEIREANGPILVNVEGGASDIEAPAVSESGGMVRVDGGHSMRNMNCNVRNGNITVRQGWRGERRPLEDYPTLVISAPSSLALHIERTLFVGEAGDLGSLDLDFDHCGGFTAGDIAGDASVDIDGSGDVRIGMVGGMADFGIDGSGDLVSLGISQSAVLGIDGSGDITTGDIGGSVDIGIDGSGDIETGRVGGAEINIDGSGNTVLASVAGGVNIGIDGSGDVVIGAGRAQPFHVEIGGSGDVRFDGEAVDLNVEIDGSGDVRVQQSSGSYYWREHGRVRQHNN
ncbi:MULTISPECIES: GIN domain-containing protein [Hyphobacterium]|uniref:GIN domain-containing protein n=1 Tax=Hyphobacterium vulgare TaxID=1736751 RepID=A0ABV6ZU69_9PROT